MAVLLKRLRARNMLGETRCRPYRRCRTLSPRKAGCRRLSLGRHVFRTCHTNCSSRSLSICHLATCAAWRGPVAPCTIRYFQSTYGAVWFSRYQTMKAYHHVTPWFRETCEHVKKDNKLVEQIYVCMENARTEGPVTELRLFQTEPVDVVPRTGTRLLEAERARICFLRRRERTKGGVSPYETCCHIVNNESNYELDRRVRSAHDLVGELLRWIIKLPRDSLESFVWDLGTCIPVQLLGPHGLLGLRQRHITEMHLRTGRHCKGDQPLSYGDPTAIGYRIDLSPFSRLRELCWRGAGSSGRWDTLQKFLRNTSSALRKLTLDLGLDHNRYWLFDRSAESMSLKLESLTLISYAFNKARPERTLLAAMD